MRGNAAPSLAHAGATLQYYTGWRMLLLMTTDSYPPGRARLKGRPLTDAELAQLSTAGMSSGPLAWASYPERWRATMLSEQARRG